MNIAVVSYSFTGNNEALAKSAAEKLQAEHIKVTEPKTRKTGKIFADMIFNRTPEVQPSPGRLENYDLILFFGPVWMGKVATPLRPYLAGLKKSGRQYGYISISGGALGENPNSKLADELKKRTGYVPRMLLDFHIADLLQLGRKPTMRDTADYKINGEEIEKLANEIVKTIGAIN